MRAITAAAAAALDAALMAEGGLFSLDTLVEAAGTCVALALVDAFPRASFPSVLVACGPGNNGCDGLVAARHLAARGYAVRVVAPARPRAPASARAFDRALAALAAFSVPVTDALPAGAPARAEVVVDAVFGFSATGAPREPFAALLAALAASGAPILSVDVPSGWAVDDAVGGAQPGALQPAALVSLTAPKPCAAAAVARGARHYVGLGGVVPPAMAAAHGLDVAAWIGAPGPLLRLA